MIFTTPERIEQRILILRGQRVMLSADLAKLYDVEPKVLMQAVKGGCGVRPLIMNNG